MAKSSMQELIDWLDPSFSSVIDKAKELLEKEKQQITDKKEFSNSLTMQKKLYYHLTDTVDSIDITLSLEDCMEAIKKDMESASETDEYEEGFSYSLAPVWLTEDTNNRLPKPTSLDDEDYMVSSK